MQIHDASLFQRPGSKDSLKVIRFCSCLLPSLWHKSSRQRELSNWRTRSVPQGAQNKRPKLKVWLVPESEMSAQRSHEEICFSNTTVSVTVDVDCTHSPIGDVRSIGVTQMTNADHTPDTSIGMPERLLRLQVGKTRDSGIGHFGNQVLGSRMATREGAKGGAVMSSRKCVTCCS